MLDTLLMVAGVFLMAGAFTGTGVTVALPVTLALVCMQIGRYIRGERVAHDSRR